MRKESRPHVSTKERTQIGGQPTAGPLPTWRARSPRCCARSQTRPQPAPLLLPTESLPSPGSPTPASWSRKTARAAASASPRPICLCPLPGVSAHGCASCVPTRALCCPCGPLWGPPRGIPALPQLRGPPSSQGPQASCLEEPGPRQVAWRWGAVPGGPGSIPPSRGPRAVRCRHEVCLQCV